MAAEEERELGNGKVTPYWRVLRPDGTVNVKFPISIQKLTELLELEGHQIEFGKGKKPPKVIDFEKKLKLYC